MALRQIDVEVGGATLAEYVERALADAAEDLEEGDTPPTPEARRACLRHFRDVASSWPASQPIPFPLCGPSGDGSIFCEWRRGTRRLLITIYPGGLIRQFTAEIVEHRAVDPRTVSSPAPAETAAVLRWVAGLQDRP